MSTADAYFRTAAGITICGAEGTAFVVIMQQQAGGIKMLDKQQMSLSEGMERLCRRVRQMADGQDLRLIIGMDCAQVRFLQVTLPAVEPEAVSELLAMQIESRLPIPSSQVSWVWSSQSRLDGLHCSIAAVKKDFLAKSAPSLDGDMICTLEAVGLAVLWRRVFGDQSGRQMLLWKRPKDFLLTAVEGGRLMHACVIDAESADGQALPDYCVQDLLDVLDSLGSGREDPLLLIAPQDALTGGIKNQLEQAGRKTVICPASELKQSLPELTLIDDPFLPAAGLAMAGLMPDSIDYDFVQIASQPSRLARSAAASVQLRRNAAVTIGLLMLCLALFFWMMKKETAMMQKTLSISYDKLTAEEVLQHQAFREAVARARPDLLDVFEKIQNSRQGVMLDSFEFEKGKPIRITATGPGYEAVYAFQRQMESQSGISQVRLLDPRLNERDKTVQFTMTFYYKHFSQ
ncbi:MAG: PilN domain-containing protein [Phycisphaerae bacterium]|nr:PilN domain-containing protein [Phycisphaerae bacterium]